MDEFLKMDIFFVVATVATIIMSVLAVLVLMSVLRILRKVEEISEMVSEEGRELRADIAVVRGELRQKGLIMGAVAAATAAFKKRQKKRGEHSP